MVSTTALAIIGQGTISALLPWVVAFGAGPFVDATTRWWLTAVIACMVGYGAAFGIGYAIHNNQCASGNVGTLAAWSAMVPGLIALVLLVVSNIRFFRSPIESLLKNSIPAASPALVFAAVYSYYLFWSTAVGATVATYQAKVC